MVVCHALHVAVHIEPHVTPAAYPLAVQFKQAHDMLHNTLSVMSLEQGWCLKFWILTDLF